MPCNAVCNNAYHNNAESLINFAPGVIPLQEQFEPYIQEYLGAWIRPEWIAPVTDTNTDGLMDEYSLSVAPVDATIVGGYQRLEVNAATPQAYTYGDLASELVIGQKYKIRIYHRGLNPLRLTFHDGVSTRYDVTEPQSETVFNSFERTFISQGTGVFSSVRIYLSSGSATPTIGDWSQFAIWVAPVYTHHKNLVTNGGLPYGTDWINPTAGLAEGWVLTNTVLASIVTGNGFNGNVQYIEADSGLSTNIKQSPDLIVGHDYKCTFKHRSSNGINLYIADGVAIHDFNLSANTGDAIESIVEFTASGVGGFNCFRFYIEDNTSTTIGYWIEIDEILLYDTADPGFDLFNYRPFQDWPADLILPDVGIGNYTAQRELSPIEKEFLYKIKKIGITL